MMTQAKVYLLLKLGGENRPENLLREHPDMILDDLSGLPAALKSMGF